VIILNGASSSGKISILKQLLILSEDPYLNVGIDKFTMVESKWAEECTRLFSPLPAFFWSYSILSKY